MVQGVLDDSQVAGSGEQIADDDTAFVVAKILRRYAEPSGIRKAASS